LSKQVQNILAANTIRVFVSHGLFSIGNTPPAVNPLSKTKNPGCRRHECRSDSRGTRAGQDKEMLKPNPAQALHTTQVPGRMAPGGAGGRARVHGKRRGTPGASPFSPPPAPLPLGENT
jgi:hypothetical protein